jgi:hypothetical protein
MAKNEQYSFKDLHNKTFTSNPAEDFSGDIIGSCFEQENPNTDVFPADATGNLLRCNLNNCAIPPGMTVMSAHGIDSINIHHKEMNDGERWIVDSGTLQPIEPLQKQDFINYGLSIDPADIPVSKLDEPIIIAKRKELGEVV